MRILIGFLTLILCLGCFLQAEAKPVLVGSGKVISENRQVESFAEVALEMPAKVILIKGEEAAIEVQAEDNIEPYVITETRGSVLYITLDLPNEYRGMRSRKGVKVTVTAPELKAVAVTGTGRVISESLWKCDDFRIRVSGSAKVDMALQGDRVDTSLSGNSEVILRGEVTEQMFSLSGSSHCDAAHMLSKRASINIGGTGSVTVNSSESLDISISGCGRVAYVGSPKIHQRVSGCAKVSQLSW